ncbi:hypothetical protein BDZ85DRAFT_32290 [Elsinoe ampelina]|uniref:Uncharacterized protein n=1 Tax=Elsinoe ampelina TaxID=302913 RepID=A0A6A6G310_9PEZI|nr:hypothetical protein BDZ85DRAFT_32290 [Elsinoe ampelina]
MGLSLYHTEYSNIMMVWHVLMTSTTRQRQGICICEPLPLIHQPVGNRRPLICLARSLNDKVQNHFRITLTILLATNPDMLGIPTPAKCFICCRHGILSRLRSKSVCSEIGSTSGPFIPYYQHLGPLTGDHVKPGLLAANRVSRHFARESAFLLIKETVKGLDILE